MTVPAFTADPARPRPYLWPSWVTKLLAGEDRCGWKAWYKVHHKYRKRADDKDREDFFREYQDKHDSIVRLRAGALREEGWDVKVEDEGEFKISGKLADVAGKPDIVALRGDVALVVDGKAGRRRDSDHWQVLLYMFALPLSWLKDKAKKVVGSVEYYDGPVPVRDLGPAERERIVAVIQMVAGDRVPDAFPSAQECRYCDVDKCPVRYRAPEGDATEYF